ncbi:KpsF/GutQ family sugar-phosphate isomerase [Candidatus Calescamantes bacterium]|nr:KpsF/GutQ family sugar-phosphate isomerase [Candidatus Calescamantes bacterium]
MGKRCIEWAKEVLEEEAKAILGVAEKLDEEFEKAVEIILSSRGRVVVTGVGKSGIVGKKISATLSSTGTPSFFLHPGEAVHGDLGMVSPEDVILAISNSGETEEITRLLPFFKRQGNSIIAFTGNPRSTLGRNADAIINVGVKKEACPLGLAPTSSTTATLAMGDALAIALLKRKGFGKKDFARIHPGGSLGKRLMLKVKDVMRTGDAIPIVEEDTLMKDAIKEISRKMLGFTTVVNKEGRLVGIITDGDLRRAWERGIKFEKAKAFEVMTKSPITISKNKYAHEALEIMEKNAITSLIIKDRKGGVEGVIHLHDILGRGEFRFEAFPEEEE